MLSSAAKKKKKEEEEIPSPEIVKPLHSLGWFVGLRGVAVYPRSEELGGKPRKRRGVTSLCFVSALLYVASLFYLKVYLGML